MIHCIYAKKKSTSNGPTVWRTIESLIFGRNLIPLSQAKQVFIFYTDIIVFDIYSIKKGKSTFYECCFLISMGVCEYTLYWLRCVVGYMCVFLRPPSEARKERREILLSWSLWVTHFEAVLPEQVYLNLLCARKEKLPLVHISVSNMMK